MKSFLDNDHFEFSNMKESGADNGKGYGPAGANTSIAPFVTSYSPGVGKGGAAAVEWTYTPGGKDETEVEWTYATAGHDDGFL
ncbi:MAG: hypothetical protein AcusKO_18660 [Acuticoccus sp.]